MRDGWTKTGDDEITHESGFKVAWGQEKRTENSWSAAGWNVFSPNGRWLMRPLDRDNLTGICERVERELAPWAEMERYSAE